MNLAEAFLIDQIPPENRSIVPTTLKTAYSAAGLIIRDEPIFNIESARFHHGRIIQWAVDAAFEKLVISGQWGDDYRWRSFNKPTGRYLEILFSHSALTISQVANPNQQPRDVGFRRNKRLASQITMDILHDDVDTSGIPHILLLHGYQDLDFAHLAIPDPEFFQGHQHKTANLMLMAHAAPSLEVPMEQTDIDAVMTLKEEIDRARRDGEL